ncbi:uncharacterized protein LOC116609874 [Nematostella vectensis]|uniref:uncharacterized protein LOC116609874 n=1 Tax=Nematostella vectensis TaxID=45351 RepID=UPI00207767A2|nr:uncharacterized protein LOC116609874 [Nematostella vectensis]
MIAEIVALFAFLFENCTGVVLIENYASKERGNEEEGTAEELRNLIQTTKRHELEEFTNFDETDDVFREFDPPEAEERDPRSWRKRLPSFRSTAWKSFKTVFLIQTLAGTALGLLAVSLAFLDFNTADLCYDKTPEWDKMPRGVQSIRVTGQAVEGFVIELWDFLLLSTAFPWSLMKELNLLTLNLLAAFIDMSYRLYFQLFGIYKVSWMSFPLNALFTLMIILNSWILGRHFMPASIKGALKYAFIFCAQFVLGMSANLFLVYKLLPWYNSVQSESVKVIVAGLCPLLTAIPKVVARLGAQKLNGVLHPGTANVFVGVLYGATAIVFRIMQAELTSLAFFIALGIGHAVVDMLERLSITMRDYLWGRLYQIIRRQERLKAKYSPPRSRRFIADISIQIMLQEATGLISALGFIHLYHFMYSDKEKPFTDTSVLMNFFTRSITGLAIDLVFNTLSVIIQTRVMNVAIIRVWRKKWRYHLVVNTIIATITMIYYTEYLFSVVRNKYNYSEHAEVRFAWNCTKPFSI